MALTAISSNGKTRSPSHPGARACVSAGPAAARAPRALDGEGLPHPCVSAPQPPASCGESLAPSTTSFTVTRGCISKKYRGQDVGGDSRAVVSVGQATAAHPVGRTSGQSVSQALLHPAVPGFSLSGPPQTYPPGPMGGLPGASLQLGWGPGTACI